MRKYEIMYIIRPDIEEEARETLMDRFKTVLTDNGAEIDKVEDMGKKRFAYEIQKYRDGYYVLMNFSSDQTAIDEFDRQAKFSEDIVRHIVVRDEE